MKSLLLFLLRYVQETECKIRRSIQAIPPKPDISTSQGEGFLMLQKLNFLMLPKLSISWYGMTWITSYDLLVVSYELKA